MRNAIFPFNNSFVELPKEFYDTATPCLPSHPELLLFNESLAHELSIPAMEDAAYADIFSGKKLPEGAQPVAMAYAGHQFGNFVPRLGDGRALLMGELKDSKGINQDIHMKGTGPTSFSRGGDGLCPLGPALREYLVSECMHTLGVPTTRALAVATTGETVYREETQPGAVITRVAESHLRVGTFEYFLSLGDKDSLKTLLAYAIKRSYPHLSSENPDPHEFFNEVCKRQALLVAKWMSLGFIHGVMNTDNCSVSGVTIDYGPCAFMDNFSAKKVFSSIDRFGRYAYNQQPTIALWNLSRLGECLISLSTMDEKQAVDGFHQALDQFQTEFQTQWRNIFRNKLGIEDSNEDPVFSSWFELLEKHSLDFTLAHRNLSQLMNNKNLEFFPESPEKENFLKVWKPVKSAEELNQTNPMFIPRNHYIEKIIQTMTKGDRSVLDKFLKRMKDPYSEGTDFTSSPKPEEEVRKTFCGT